VKGPEPRIVGIEGYDHPPARRDQYGVAHGAGKALAIDLNDLEFMTV